MAEQIEVSIFGLQYIERQIIREFYRDIDIMPTEARLQYHLDKLKSIHVAAKHPQTWLAMLSDVINIANLSNVIIGSSIGLDKPIYKELVLRGKEFLVDREFFMALGDAQEALEKRSAPETYKSMIDDVVLRMFRLIIQGTANHRATILSHLNADKSSYMSQLDDYHFCIALYLTRTRGDLVTDVFYNYIHSDLINRDKTWSHVWGWYARLLLPRQSSTRDDNGYTLGFLEPGDDGDPNGGDYGYFGESEEILEKRFDGSVKIKEVNFGAAGDFQTLVNEENALRARLRNLAMKEANAKPRAISGLTAAQEEAVMLITHEPFTDDGFAREIVKEHTKHRLPRRR